MSESEVVSLKDYFENRLADVNKFFEARLSAIEKATAIATNTLDKRLEGMNEFRSAMKDQSEKFLSKDDYQLRHTQIESDIRMLRESKSLLEGKSSRFQLVAIASLIIALMAFVGHLFHLM